MGTWYVIQGDGKIYELREKEVTHKLNTARSHMHAHTCTI